MSYTKTYEWHQLNSLDATSKTYLSFIDYTLSQVESKKIRPHSVRLLETVFSTEEKAIFKNFWDQYNVFLGCIDVPVFSPAKYKKDVQKKQPNGEYYKHIEEEYEQLYEELLEQIFKYENDNPMAFRDKMAELLESKETFTDEAQKKSFSYAMRKQLNSSVIYDSYLVEEKHMSVQHKTADQLVSTLGYLIVYDKQANDDLSLVLFSLKEGSEYLSPQTFMIYQTRLMNFNSTVDVKKPVWSKVFNFMALPIFYSKDYFGALYSKTLNINGNLLSFFGEDDSDIYNHNVLFPMTLDAGVNTKYKTVGLFSDIMAQFEANNRRASVIRLEYRAQVDKLNNILKNMIASSVRVPTVKVDAAAEYENKRKELKRQGEMDFLESLKTGLDEKTLATFDSRLGLTVAGGKAVNARGDGRPMLKRQRTDASDLEEAKKTEAEREKEKDETDMEDMEPCGDIPPTETITASTPATTIDTTTKAAAPSKRANLVKPGTAQQQQAKKNGNGDKKE